MSRLTDKLLWSFYVCKIIKNIKLMAISHACLLNIFTAQVKQTQSQDRKMDLSAKLHLFSRNRLES